MWECNDCHEEFETPILKEIVFEDEYKLKNLFPTTHRIKVATCPNCKSSDVEELRLCDCCGEWNKDEDLIDTEGMTGGGVGFYCCQCIKDCGVGQ